MTVTSRDFAVPEWAQQAVWYYVFPERFRNGDVSNDPRPGPNTFQNGSVENHAEWNARPFRPGSGDGSDSRGGNDFFGGDLAGLIEKLDHIAALGATALYMTPIFTAASNHKYDTGDYRNVDPAFGANADFERLTREAARRGIRVVVDASFNHTGRDTSPNTRASVRWRGARFAPTARTPTGTASTQPRPTRTNATAAGPERGTCRN